MIGPFGLLFYTRVSFFSAYLFFFSIPVIGGAHRRVQEAEGVHGGHVGRRVTQAGQCGSLHHGEDRGQGEGGEHEEEGCVQGAQESQL